MPLYEYECTTCDSGRIARVKTLSQYQEPEYCKVCGNQMKRLISTPMFRIDNIRYQCPITGKPITNRRQHEENLAKQGCRVLETGEKEEFVRKRQREDDELANKVAETAAKLVHDMPQEKKEALASELARTDSVSYDRG